MTGFIVTWLELGIAILAMATGSKAWIARFCEAIHEAHDKSLARGKRQNMSAGLIGVMVLLIVCWPLNAIFTIGAIIAGDE